MKASLDSVKQGLARYLDGEFIPNYRKTHTAVATYAFSVVAALAIENLGVTAQTLVSHPLTSFLGVVDEDNNIDVTKVLGQMRKSMPDEGLKVPVPAVGLLTFTKEDVDALEGYMQM